MPCPCWPAVTISTGRGWLIRTSPSRRHTSANVVNRACPLPICGSCSAAVRSSRRPISRRTTIWMHHGWANDAASVRAAVVTSVRLPCRGMVVTGYGRKAGGIPPALYHHPGNLLFPGCFSLYSVHFSGSASSDNRCRMEASGLDLRPIPSCRAGNGDWRNDGCIRFFCLGLRLCRVWQD